MGLPLSPFRIIFRRVRRRRVVRRTRVRSSVKTAAARASYLEHKEAARTIVREAIARINAVYGLPIKKVAIRDQRTRWGSCSKDGNLNFNYRIAHLPPHLADYLVAHELCHLLEFNHSRAFWAHVARAVPEWQKCRAELMKMRLR